MPVDTWPEQKVGTAGALDAWLQDMMTRLLARVAAPLTDAGVIEMATIYNNVAYLFLYLEANEEHVSCKDLFSWRPRFFDDVRLRRRMLLRLLSLQCQSSDAESTRLAYIDELRRSQRDAISTHEKRLNELLTQSKDILRSSRAAESSLLQRLGVPVGNSRPAAVFYELMSNTEDARVRDKLGSVWRSRRAAPQGTLLPLIDEMVDVRRKRAAASGYERPIDEALARCTTSYHHVEQVLQDYLQRAMVNHEALLARVGVATGGSASLTQHFGQYVRSVVGDARVPTFTLDSCLAYIFSVATATFALEFEIRPSPCDSVIRAAVSNAGAPVGQIYFQLWSPRDRAAQNGRWNLRNRTNAPASIQPVAHVFSGVRDSDGTVKTLTFEDVHSLFHEFGHAINHLMIAHRVSSRSGLEYLPLERLEYLSMWFEKWAYHASFVETMAATVTPDGSGACQRIKAIEYRRTHLERAVVAALDWTVHCRTRGGLQEAFGSLDSRYGIGRYLALSELLEYFTWPMFQANPGANFAYVWGAADSVEKFTPFERLSLNQVAHHPELRKLFAASFEFSAAARTPSMEALFAFYDRVAAESQVTPSAIEATLDRHRPER